ncbi:hypothetical protein QJU43_04620 [Pasteurella atlantica]|uniref:hypothetical protein n=1 Tax=Pasteurellaceae TaxID=712 RepID=UPI00275D412E|nr:hypothetical protein [Pasteurella atlantica]MDP8033591.1 hypothetical protein [Pasteurella atlantica]MDP8035629.1 hypothetical protein [Pasteurella atlantica]MDP8037580.1 hypothetical protein [Pasteurella atlantica]MDP8047929.1 hypothetical protein [Pasteurella atlantica]MDP8049884.1 hypothetical protein [Pasteurella atlantica]
MKLAIPNIITLVYKLLLSFGALLLGLLFCYRFLPEGEIVLIVAIILLVTSLGFFFLYKSKIIWVNKKGIYCFHLLTRNYKQILWEKSHRIDCLIRRYNGGFSYRHIKITNKDNVEIRLSDDEFENFNTLITYIKNGQKQLDKMNIEFAQLIKMRSILITLCLLSFILFYFTFSYQYITYKSYFIIPTVCFLLSIRSFNKVLWCYKVIKDQKQ